VQFNDAPVATPMLGVVKTSDGPSLEVVTAAVAILAAVIAAEAMSSEFIAPASKFAPADRFSAKVFTAVKFAFICAASITVPLLNVFGILNVAITFGSLLFFF
jgi:hypothetical protein